MSKPNAGKKNPRKNGPRKMVSWKKNPRKNGPLEKRSLEKWYFRYFIELIKNVTVIFVTNINIDKYKYRQILDLLKMGSLSSFGFHRLRNINVKI